MWKTILLLPVLFVAPTGPRTLDEFNRLTLVGVKSELHIRSVEGVVVKEKKDLYYAKTRYGTYRRRDNTIIADGPDATEWYAMYDPKTKKLLREMDPREIKIAVDPDQKMPRDLSIPNACIYCHKTLKKRK